VWAINEGRGAARAIWVRARSRPPASHKVCWRRLIKDLNWHGSQSMRAGLTDSSPSYFAGTPGTVARVGVRGVLS
jgi:hypothetical protein